MRGGVLWSPVIQSPILYVAFSCSFFSDNLVNLTLPFDPFGQINLNILPLNITYTPIIFAQNSNLA